MNDINVNNSKILFCLTSTNDCGKTHVIRNLYDLFKKNNISFKSTLYSTIDSNFSDIFTIQINHKEIFVGILSAGDDDTIINNELKKFIKCDYIICASKTKESTRNEIENFANKNKFILRQINKSYFWETNETQKYGKISDKEIDTFNEHYSVFLYSLINDYLNGKI
nr:hypothetical protein [Treponema sp.]